MNYASEWNWPDKPLIIWKSSCGRAVIWKMYENYYKLDYDHVQAITGNYACVTNYLWAEFMIEPEFSR